MLSKQTLLCIDCIEVDPISYLQIHRDEKQVLVLLSSYVPFLYQPCEQLLPQQQ